jgi:hypothetical protein
MDIAVISVNFKSRKKDLINTMDEKISLEAIAAYGDAYADKVSKTFFTTNKKIRGSEILSLCKVPQVNMFVVRELLLTWREETKKLKSPYFDYEDAEVKEALNNFMTVLSKRIAVGEDYFVPLLKKAVRQTLLVIFNPYDFFSILVSGKNNRIELKEFKEEIKYLKINKAPLARLVQKLEEKGLTELSGNEAFAILDQILEEVSFTPEDLDPHIRQFSLTLPLDAAAFFPKAAPAPKPSQEVKVNNNQRVDRKTVAEEPVKASEKSTAKPIINDRPQATQRPAVYNNFQKIAKIKDNLTINQKFMFTKVLFYGDFESFSRAIDELDQLSDMDAALQYLEKQSGTWDRESREFHEFMEMVEKRFA